MIKVLIAEDIALFRDGLKTIIEQDQEIKVIGCACNGKEAVEQCIKHVPDIVLMDIKMPVLNGIEATRLIKETNSSIRVLILTTFYEDDDMSKAFEFGADGYVLKDLEQDELITTIKNIVKGLNVFHRRVVDNVRKQYHSKKETGVASEKSGAEFNLTERELDIIRLIIEGKKNKEICELLFITEGSVKNITSKILRKLNLEDRTQLAIFAVKNGLI
ncbi:MAG: response regulator transcription factor [Clostridia bacterium]|nr:response regulator transcription factor [Clostridia bacterium]